MNSNHSTVWDNCLRIIKDNIPSISYKTWFEPIVPVNLENDVLTIQVPSAFFYEYLEEQYIDLLSKTLRKQLGNGAKLEYRVVLENPKVSHQKPYTVNLSGKNQPRLKNNPVNMPNSRDENTITNPFNIPGVKKIQVDPQLKPEYTFDNYVEGKCNRLARSAGYAVAQDPGGTAFNPLVIHGDSGLGKTHLINAIGIEVKQRYPEKQVLYVTANRFMTQFAEATRNNNRNDFLHFYQMIDVLIIDDVQELAGRDKTQMVFFHIFNHLHQNKKQLILTSDKPPVELNGLENRLLSRFKWGLTADLKEPEEQTRIEILKNKAHQNGMDISEDVFNFLANNVKQNVRELEGAMVSLLAQSTLNREEITVSLAHKAIRNLVKTTKKEISVNDITQTVCEYFKMKPEVLQQKTRKREIVQARQIAMYFAKHMTQASLASIGAQIGRKDHATVLHACKTVNNLKETDKNFQTYVSDIRKRLIV